MSYLYNRATLRVLLPLRRQMLVLVLAVREVLQGEARRLTHQWRLLLVAVGEAVQKGVRDWRLSSRPRGRTGYSEPASSTGCYESLDAGLS